MFFDIGGGPSGTPPGFFGRFLGPTGGTIGGFKSITLLF